MFSFTQFSTKHTGFIIVALALAGCSPTRMPMNNRVSDLNDLTSATAQKTLQMSGIRYSALRDVALSVGARGGLAWRARKLNEILGNNTRTLDRIFNFTPLMLENNIMPPVLIEGRNTYEQSDANSIRLTDRMYSIHSPAKFVTATPTWRDYLWFSQSKPELPDRSLLPRGANERKVWDKYIRQGWTAGILQADNMLKENLGRLKRDLTGVIRYRILLAQNIVSPPYLAKRNSGITGGGNELAINDRSLTISEQAQLKPQTDEWRTEIQLIEESKAELKALEEEFVIKKEAIYEEIPELDESLRKEAAKSDSK